LGVAHAGVAAGLPPPLLDLLSSSAFSLLGEDPRSQQLLGIGLFALLAGAVERLLVPYLASARQRVAAAFAVVICPSLAITLFLVSRRALVVVMPAAPPPLTAYGPSGRPPGPP